jgi:predicted aldo/keto reductase-like oxidoreductase
MAVSKGMRGGDIMRRAMWAAVIVIAATLILTLNRPASTAAQGQLSAEDIISKNVQAAGGAEALARVKTVSFTAGPAGYTASAEGRMKVRYVLEEPAVYETLIVSGRSVRRNSLNRVSDLSGVDRGRWICLARLVSGLFTLKNFSLGLTYEGLKIFGPERHHILSTEVEGLRASFSVDATDFLVKRMVLSGVELAGEGWKESTEFGSAEIVEGIQLPTALYVSQVGVGGTYSPGPRPLADFRINADLPTGFFDDLKVNAGRAEASLKRLQTDYLDIAMVHSVDEPDKLDNEEVIAAFTQLKKDGKARFIGLSTHRPAELLKKAMSSETWEAILLIYNHMEGPPIEPLVAEAGKKGIGLIAMKVFAGGLQGSLKPLVTEKQRYSQAAIRWTLGNPHIAACIVTMSTFSHVDEYIAVSGMPLQREDPAVLSRYRLEAGPHYCRVSCRECLASCRHGVAINEVLRCAMYFEDYGMEKSAVELYKQLGQARKPAACLSCDGPCEAACPHGLAVRAKLVRSHGLLET